MQKLRLVKLADSKDVWAIGEDGSRNQIINLETFERGQKMGLWNGWDRVEMVANLDEWPEGSAIVLIKSE